MNQMISLRSKITKELLGYFFLHEDSRMYLNEICGKLELDKRNLKKKLKELIEEGLFSEEKEKNMKYYSLNKDYPLYAAYKKIVLNMIGGKSKAAVNIAKSFKEARNWEREYEESLSPGQRHKSSFYLKEVYCRLKGIKPGEISPVIKIKKSGDTVR